MIKKLSLRWRLTLLTSLLIAVCCIGLSIVLNVSASQMANSIDATLIQPALSTNPHGLNVWPTPSYQLPSETARQAKHLYLMDSLLYTAIAVLSGGVLTYCISGKALEPVRVLNEQIKNINAHNLNESLDEPAAKDELAELTVSFNDMTDKLAQAFAVQKRFSADAAHELRTPLTIMQTKLDVFRKSRRHTPEEYEALTAVFDKQVKRLRGLVTELLDIANMEHEFQKETVSMQKLLRDVERELSSLAKQKHVSLSLNGGEAFACGEYDLLYRAFYNLTENAIKYNVAGGKVALNVEVKEDFAVITVTDTGIGIADSQKSHIFEPFYRVDKSRSREMGGAGLGLSLVDYIVRKHDGSITVSDYDDCGSQFTVTLPIWES